MNLKLFLTGSTLLVAGIIYADENPVININTDNISLIYRVNDNGRLYQTYLGKRLNNESDFEHLPSVGEAVLTHGMEDYFEPALHIVHNDNNPSTELKYISHTNQRLDDGSNQTVITLADNQYPVTVNLYYVSYPNENVIKTYTEISHREKKPVKLQKYASSLLHLNRSKYYLTEFAGDWANEANITESQLSYGKKIIDTKLGTRANMFVSPFFQLAIDTPAGENNGEVIVGTIGWTGNFQYTFEVDNLNNLRILSGINPYASEYALPSGEVFRTPDFYFTYSCTGRGQASRNFHDWARNFQVKDGDKSRMTLLNNWEATYFDFNEDKLISLIGEAEHLGVDMFLLDDGWFANKYPRSSDHQGLGDWKETVEKLPNGIGRLTEEAGKKGVKFGLWIEPEMVNPKSELYEKHKDWVIHLPNRQEYYFRNQMVLDLSNPAVQDYVFGVVDNLMTNYPDIAFFKWDCNSPITNIHSAYLKEKQSHLYIDYVKGLYNVLERVQSKYPDLPMMLCAGGGGRSDFQALKYFTEFWPSDNTDPVKRLYIQWGFSQVFPSKTLCAHVTTWNKNASVKFRTNVAMMGKLGFDIKMDDLTADEQTYCRDAIRAYNGLKPVILDGDLYRLVSPYEGEHTSSMYIDKRKENAVVFAFDIHPRYGEYIVPTKLQGLDAGKKYKVKEINLMPGTTSDADFNEKVYSGNYLMTVGLNLFTGKQMNSRVVEVISL